MPTSLESALNSYMRSRKLSQGTRDEYLAMLRKWKLWGREVSVEELERNDIREFLDWVYERAVLEKGANPGRTANKSRDSLRAVVAWT